MENVSDRKESSQCLWVHDHEDSGEVNPILGKKKGESRMSKKINKRAETDEEHSRLAEPHNAVRAKKSVNVDPDSRIGLDINL